MYGHALGHAACGVLGMSARTRMWVHARRRPRGVHPHAPLSTQPRYTYMPQLLLHTNTREGVLLRCEIPLASNIRGRKSSEILRAPQVGCTVGCRSCLLSIRYPPYRVLVTAYEVDDFFIFHLLYLVAVFERKNEL